MVYGDSTISMNLKNLCYFFSEVYFSWNHFSLNSKLIKFYNPDIFIEIRTERLLSIPTNILNDMNNFDCAFYEKKFWNVIMKL